MIGQQKDAKKTRKVGGQAFPKDYNWICPICGSDCRAFEITCYACEIADWQKGVK